MDRVKKKIHCLDEIDSLIGRFKKKVGAKHNKDLAQLLEISDRDFSNRKYKGTLFKLIVEWAISRKMDINSLVYGEESGVTASECCKKDVSTAGEPALSSRYDGIDGCCAFMREIVIATSKNQENICLMVENGDSMEPTIYNGESVMVDTGRILIHEGGIFVFRMGSNIMTKRLSVRPGDKIKIISDNKEYESYEVSREDIQILAQVIWIFRSLVN